MSAISTMSNFGPDAIRKQVSDATGWFLAIGVLLVLLGMAAIAMPLFSTIAATIWIGWALLASGALMLLHALFAWRWPSSLWSILVALLYLSAGSYILYAPLTGALSLTFVMAALFIAEGFFEIIQAFRMRSVGGWGWVLFSGVAAVAAGVLIAMQLPGSAAWVLGLLFGVNLLSTGLSFIFVAQACRDGAKRI